MKKRRLREWLSIQIVKNPSRTILLAIALFNLLFFVFAAVVISNLAPASLANRGFWASLFYTITMILDAGCIQFVVEDVGQVGVAVIIACMLTVLIGMITFTGCVIGYITNWISSFIDNANSGSQKLLISEHTIILNWNSRASEIVNDLMYSKHPESIVILVSENKEAVEAEIGNRLADTLALERKKLLAACRGMGMLRQMLYCRRHEFKNRLTVIVRQGDTFSTKQLMDISLDRAKSVIILNRDETGRTCRYATEERSQSREKGNSLTVKTLVLVAEITAAESSADDQKIIVEVDDNWTLDLVNKIIRQKERSGKCNIVPVAVNKILGQLLSQFSIMPQLNMVYSELFSNQGAEFFSAPVEDQSDSGDDILEFLSGHDRAIPLTAMMTTKHGMHRYYMADWEEDVFHRAALPDNGFSVRCNPEFWLPRRNVLILGHNSKVSSLMDGFESFRAEWNPAADGRDILNLTFVDDAKHLEKMDHYRSYSYVNQNHVVEADVFDQEKIYAAINSFIDDQDGDTAILILSDDSVPAEDLDASALTYLIYVQDIIARRKAEKAARGEVDERIDVIVEILNPKNYDVVHSYSVNNVVISNRYISKMITQISEKDTLFDLYVDILTYDSAAAAPFVSKELYIKQAGEFFLELPGPCTAADLIRAVYRDIKAIGSENTASLLGYITDVPQLDESGAPTGEAEDQLIFFAGDQTQIPVALKPADKLIVFSNH